MLRPTISSWSKLGTRVPRHFFSDSVLLLAATIVASAATTELPDAVNGIAYSVQLHFLAVTPISATVPDNVLPKGLSLSPDGLISGTPVIASDRDFNFTATVTDSSHPPQTLQFDYHIRGVSDPPPAQTNSADMGAAKQVRSRNREGNSSGFDPATFVEIYEDTKAGGHIRIHNPAHSHKRGSHLSVDAESSVVIVPDSSLLENSDLSLNKLFMSAVLSSGDKQQNLEVVGYSEVGKDKSSTAA